MYTYWYVQLWTLVKLEISCQSIRPNWPTWENWGVRSPYYRWWTCQTWSTLPPSCIRVYAYMCIYVLVYDTVCLCIYVYEPVKRDKHRVRLVVRSISGDIMTSSLKSSLKMLWTLGSLISQMSNKVPDWLTICKNIKSEEKSSKCKEVSAVFSSMDERIFSELLLSEKLWYLEICCAARRCTWVPCQSW